MRIGRFWFWASLIGGIIAADLFVGGLARGQTFTGQTFTAKIAEPDHPTNTHTLILANAANRWYENCTFIGDGIKLDACQTFTFSNCTITGARRTSGNHQAVFLAGCNNITFKNLRIADCTQAAAIFGTSNLSWIGGTIGGTELGKGVDYGIQASVGGSKHWLFDGVRWSRDRAMGVEFQNDDASTDDITFENCAYADAERWSIDPYPSNNGPNSGARMAFSMPFTVAKHVVIRNNYAGGPVWLIDKPGQQRVTGPDWIGIRIGFEFGGDGAILGNNWLDRLNRAGSAIAGSSNLQVGANLVTGCTSSVYMDGSQPYPHNDASTILTGTGGWTLLSLSPPGSVPPTTNPTPPATLPSLPALTHTIQIYSDGSFRVMP